MKWGFIIRNFLLMAFLGMSTVYSCSIEIPSDPNIVGSPAVKYHSQQVEQSWSHLDSYTSQTLENFKRGEARGFLLVHSLEYIMGATDSFELNWNKNHERDQRNATLDRFHQIFSEDEFVRYYGEYVLANRALISCSMLAFNEQFYHTLAETFSPVSFVLTAPYENILVARKKDCQTPVVYGKSLAQPAYNYWGCPNITFDSLIRFPQLGKVIQGEAPNRKISWEMNEIGVLSCTYKEEAIHRPAIAGVLINHITNSFQRDEGNSGRNRGLIEAARKFSSDQGLPLIEIKDNRAQFNEKDVLPLIAEFLGAPATLNNYEWPCGDPAINESSFLLNGNQLGSYGMVQVQ